MNEYLKWLLSWLCAYDKSCNYWEDKELFYCFIKEKFGKELDEEKRKDTVFKS